MSTSHGVTMVSNAPFYSGKALDVRHRVPFAAILLVVVAFVLVYGTQDNVFHHERMLEFRDFLAEHGDIVLKPLGGMGGESVFRLRHGDPNTNVVIETLTARESRYAMAQRFIPEIAQGDKRILLVDGEPIPYALARVPAEGETRGNLAAGGTGVGVPLSERDRWICAQVGPELRRRGILFAGLDVIGDYLTEINVTSPTCIRELDAEFGLNIAGALFDALERMAAA